MGEGIAERVKGNRTSPIVRCTDPYTFTQVREIRDEQFDWEGTINLMTGEYEGTIEVNPEKVRRWLAEHPLKSLMHLEFKVDPTV